MGAEHPGSLQAGTRSPVVVGGEDREGDREAQRENEHHHRPVEQVLEHELEADEKHADLSMEGKVLEEPNEERQRGETQQGSQEVE